MILPKNASRDYNAKWIVTGSTISDKCINYTNVNTFIYLNRYIHSYLLDMYIYIHVYTYIH